ADRVRITAAPLENTAPVAAAGDDQVVVVGTEIALDGSGSMDADGDPLTFAWAISMAPEGSAATVGGADMEMATFTPDLVGAYVLRLVVNDGMDDSAPDFVNLEATPE